MNQETMMLRCAIEEDEEWTDEVQAALLGANSTEEESNAVADSLEYRLSMLAKGRHELKEIVLLALSIGSVWRIDFDALVDHFGSGFYSDPLDKPQLES